MNDRLERLTPPPTSEIIGRARERQAVIEAILGTESCALHFLGKAGIGVSPERHLIIIGSQLPCLFKKGPRLHGRTSSKCKFTQPERGLGRVRRLCRNGE